MASLAPAAPCFSCAALSAPSSGRDPSIAAHAPLALLLAVAFMAHAPAQQAPLNANVSDFGTSFVYSPPPLCRGCVETEAGFTSLNSGHSMPTVLTVAAPRGSADFTVLLNALDSESVSGNRVTQFGNRVDFVLRQKLYEKGGFELTLSPRGTAFVRGPLAGRAGLSLGPQYAHGRNLAIFNYNLTGAVGVSAANPRMDSVAAFDYYRTVNHRGDAFFVGVQHEYTAGLHTAALEEGFLLAFRNGQIEIANQQLNLNTTRDWQLQARVIVNWGRVFGQKHR